MVVVFDIVLPARVLRSARLAAGRGVRSVIGWRAVGVGVDAGGRVGVLVVGVGRVGHALGVNGLQRVVTLMVVGRVEWGVTWKKNTIENWLPVISK